MKKIVIIMALLIATILFDFLVRLTGSNFIKFLKVASIVAMITILFWNFIKKFPKISIIILIILFFILFATLNKNDTTKKKQTEEVTKVTSEKESTEEKATTEETTKKEEEETTSETVRDGSNNKDSNGNGNSGGNTGNSGGNTGNSGGNTGNSNKGYAGEAATQSNMPETQQATDGKVGGEKTTSSGSSNANPEKRTTTSTERREEATTPAATEKPGGRIISPTNPYTDKWEEETTQQPTTKPDIVIDDPVPETTKQQEETTKSTLVELPTVPEAYANFSFTKGAGNCNILVTFNKSTNATFKVCWYTQATEYRSVKNSDGSYSLKVSVPENFKGKLNVTIYDLNGNEIGSYSKVIDNLNY